MHFRRADVPTPFPRLDEKPAAAIPQFVATTRQLIAAALCPPAAPRTAPPCASSATSWHPLPRGSRDSSPKAFVDSVVYRGGDALAAWLSQALPASALVPAALALCAVWLMNSLALARIGEQRKGRLR
jgi:hypothetical protein